MPRISSVDLEFTLTNGETVKASISAEYGWQQWGNVPSVLGETVDACDAISQALYENGLMASEDEEEDEDA